MKIIQINNFFPVAFLMLFFVFIGQVCATSDAPINSDKNKVDKSSCERSGGTFYDFEEGGKTITACVRKDDSSTECNGETCMECKPGRRECGPVGILSPSSNFSQPLIQAAPAKVLSNPVSNKGANPVGIAQPMPTITPNTLSTSPLVAPSTGVRVPTSIMQKSPTLSTKPISSATDAKPTNNTTISDSKLKVKKNSMLESN